MPSSALSPAAQVVLAVLLEAKQAGTPQLTRTALVKFVYLYDYLNSAETGSTATELPWYFHHFGPFAAPLIDELQLIVKSNLIWIDEGESLEKEYILYRLPDYHQAATFEALGLPGVAASRLRRWIRELSQDLPRLLDFVYFRTEPMAGAKPGQKLDFGSVSRLDFKTNFAPVKIVINDQKAARIRTLAAQLSADWQARQRRDTTISDAIHDDAYMAAFADIEDGVPDRDYVVELQF